MSSSDLRLRVTEHSTAWDVAIEHMVETESSVLAFGRRGEERVVLKVVKLPGDEWLSGAVLSAFEGRGVVRVLGYAEGALLLERLTPGDSLTGLALNGQDAAATEILADVIGRMSPAAAINGVPLVEDWGRGFERYQASGATQIPEHLLEQHHGGSLPGFRAELARFPDDTLTVIVLTNADGAQPDEIARGVARFYLSAPERSTSSREK